MLSFTREQFKAKYEMLCIAHHMTSIKNLDSIFTEGFLLPLAEVNRRKISFDDLSMDEVQQRRAGKIAPCGRSLHEYVPLYYSFKTPMAAKRQARNGEWVYLTFGIEQIAGGVDGVVIADGNAAADATQMRNLKSIDDFAILDKKSLYSTSYAGNAERGRKKSAELLVPDRLSLDFLIWISAIDQATISRVNQIIQPFNRQHIKCQVKADWFFAGQAQPGEGGFFT